MYIRSQNLINLMMSKVSNKNQFFIKYFLNILIRQIEKMLQKRKNSYFLNIANFQFFAINTCLKNYIK